MAHYLVTGGAGFIGSHLAEALCKKGHQVTILDNLSTGKKENLPKEAHFIEGCILDRALLEKIFSEIEGCFHLAAIASVQKGNEEWVKTHQVNLTGTINLFEAAALQKKIHSRTIPIVFASSAAVYGDIQELPLDEGMPLSPLSAYGADKYGCELHGKVARYVHSIPNVGLRFFNVFGPRQDPKSPYSGVISIFMHRILNDLPLHIHGDGLQSRDFINVFDVVEALMKAFEYAKTQKDNAIFNVCRGESVTILDLVRTLSHIAQKEPHLEYTPVREGDIRASLGNPEKALKNLRFKANITLEEGLRQILKY
jgi:UDP-glucose 4-epimerase